MEKEIIDILSTEERRVQSYSSTIHGLIEQPRSSNPRKAMRQDWNKKHSYVVDEGKTGHQGDRRVLESTVLEMEYGRTNQRLKPS